MKYPSTAATVKSRAERSSRIFSDSSAIRNVSSPFAPGLVPYVMMTQPATGKNTSSRATMDGNAPPRRAIT